MQFLFTASSPIHEKITNNLLFKSPLMQRMAFKMKVFQGFETEYQRRHDEIWPDLKKLLKTKGIKHYSIFLDEETNLLIGYLMVENPNDVAELANEPVVKKWWSFMKDVMETNNDHSPVAVPLKEVFYLP